MQVILLVNLGSPNEASIPSIRLFLRKFLSDKRVIGLPRILWLPILYGVILPLRSNRLLKQYQSVWLDTESPLIYYTRMQQELLQGRYKENILVKYAFSYSAPYFNDELEDLHKKYSIDKLTVLPLYPQFSSTTTSAVFDQTARFYADKKYLPNLNFIRDFHDNSYYIEAIAETITKHFIKYGKPERLIFSYHSLPVKIIEAGDVYYEQCLASSELIAGKLNLTKDEYQITFQSKFGRDTWITPATAETLALLPKAGVKNIAVVCPGFISDCLETLEEIEVTNREIFINNGGATYQYIPCLNCSDLSINLLYQLTRK
jgi:ferrochelatase